MNHRLVAFAKEFRMSNRMQVVVGLAIVLFVVLPIALLFGPWWPFGMGSLVALAMAYPTVIYLANHNIIFTFVEQGWFRIVLKAGKFHRIIKPGFHVIGIPGIHTLHSRKMSFLKAVVKEDGAVEAKVHEDEGVNSFKSTRYPYAVPFKDVEDKNGLHMHGLVIVKARMRRPRVSFFSESDWYASMNMEVMPRLRNALDEVSYAEAVGSTEATEETEEAARRRMKDVVNTLLNEAMNARGDDGLSSIEKILKLCGLDISSIDLASIDPPDNWRNITLAPYEAEQKAKAAKHQAEASATLLDDTNQALEAWKKVHPKASQEQIDEKQRELARRAYLKAGGQYQEVHGLENAGTVVIGGGGGGAGVLLGGQNSGGRRKNTGEKNGTGSDLGDLESP